MRPPAATAKHGGIGIRRVKLPADALEVRLAASAAVAGIGVLAIAIWASSLRQVDLRALDDLGLISALPPAFFVGPVLLNAAFALTLRMRRPPTALFVLQVLALILMLYGVTSIVEEVPRISIGWLHAGFAELIGRTGELPELDARFDWPLFFAVAAVLTAVGGFSNPIELAHWVPLLLNVLYLGPLVLLFSAVSTDRRLVWLAVWIFYLANWVGQDYFSPQGFAYLLYLALLATLLRWFRAPATSRGWLEALATRIRGRTRAPLQQLRSFDEAEQQVTRRQSAGLAALLVVMFAAVVASHQLTPFALLAGVTALVLFNRSSLRGLPMLMAVMIGTWISYMTVSFLSGHLEGLLANLGEAQDIAEANVAARLIGSPEHVFVVQLRIVFTLFIWLVAAVGSVRRLRAGYWDLSFALLAGAPFGLIFLHGYGGELLLRVYFFSLPFMAFFAAAALYPRPAVAGLGRSAAVVVMASLMVVGFVVARYGNERADMLTAAEVDAVAQLYDRIEPGALIATSNHNSVVGYREFEMHDYFRVRNSVLIGDVRRMSEALRQAANGEAYVVLTRGQQAADEMFAGLPPGAWERFVDQVRRSPEYEVVLSNRDATIFRLIDGGGEEP